METGRTLIIHRDGRKHAQRLAQQLPTGAKASLETAAAMKKIVLEDVRERDLRNFVFRVILDGATTQDEQIARAFVFCRDEIVYQDEQDGRETLADLWSCMYFLNDEKPVGDCAIKSIALATILSFIGLKPYFIVIRQIPGVDFFNHIFVGATIYSANVTFDPTPKEFRPGDELPSLERKVIKIYD